MAKCRLWLPVAIAALLLPAGAADATPIDSKLGGDDFPFSREILMRRADLPSPEAFVFLTREGIEDFKSRLRSSIDELIDALTAPNLEALHSVPWFDEKSGDRAPVVPEPSSATLLACGLAGLALLRRLRAAHPLPRG